MLSRLREHTPRSHTGASWHTTAPEAGAARQQDVRQCAGKASLRRSTPLRADPSGTEWVCLPSCFRDTQAASTCPKEGRTRAPQSPNVSLEKPQSIKWHKGQIKQVHLNVPFRWLFLALPLSLFILNITMYALVTPTFPWRLQQPTPELSPIPLPHTSLPTASGQFQKTCLTDETPRILGIFWCYQEISIQRDHLKECQSIAPHLTLTGGYKVEPEQLSPVRRCREANSHPPNIPT